MQIDYYCFPTKTGDISVFTDLDQYSNWRERDYYQYTQEDVLLAKEKGKLLLFDLRNNSFIDENGEQVDISGKVIFPRSPIGESDILLENIEKTQAKCITARKDYEIVENWFRLVKTQRQLKITTRREIEKNLDVYEKEYGNKLFIKTIKKGFSGICKIIEFSFSEDGPKSKYLVDSHFHSLNMSISDPNVPVLVCKALNLLRDEYGKREWRAFVVNDELLCLSRCSDDVVPIEEYVYDKVKNNIKEFRGIMPSSYVVDFFEYADDDGKTVFDVCEFNPIIASGVFQNNDLVF